MRKANIRLLIAMAVLVAVVAAAGLLFGGGLQTPGRGKGPIAITGTQGLIIPDPENADAYNVPDGANWLSVSCDGFTYPPVPLTGTGDYTFTQPDGGYNLLHVTPDSIRMSKADCSTQDCIHQGAATVASMDFRPLGGQIICLPHKLIVQLVPDGQLDSIILPEDMEP